MKSGGAQVSTSCYLNPGERERELERHGNRETEDMESERETEGEIEIEREIEGEIEIEREIGRERDKESQCVFVCACVREIERCRQVERKKENWRYSRALYTYILHTWRIPIHYPGIR